MYFYGLQLHCNLGVYIIMGHCRKNIISILTAEACNLDCRYCYNNEEIERRQQKPRVISYDFAKKGIDDFFYDNLPAIRFFGVGEATVAFNQLREIYDYSYRKAGDDLYSELQTNGFFSDYICNWVKDNIDMIWVSLDGPPDIQNYHRPTKNGEESAQIIENNILTLTGAGKIVGIRSTIGNKNVSRQKEMIDYFSKLGVSAVFADHMCLDVIKGGNLSKSRSLVEIDSVEYAEKFIEATYYADKKGMFYSNFLMVNFDEHVDIACRVCIPSPQLNPSGYVSACDMITDKTNGPMDSLLIGKYYPDTKKIIYYQKNIERLKTRVADMIPGCSDCSIKHHCAGGCLGEAINETGSFWGIKNNLCEATRLLAKTFGVSYQERFPFLHP